MKCEIAIVALLGVFTGELLRGGLYVVSATLAVLLHELGHAEAARRFGHIASIRLHMFGGTTYHMGMPMTRRREAIVTLAGPAVGLILGGIAFAIQRLGNIHSDPLRDFIWVNAGWAMLNLLPILPLR